MNMTTDDEVWNDQNQVHYIYISTFDILFLHQNYYGEVQSEEN